MDASPPASIPPHPLPLSRLEPGAGGRVLVVPEWPPALPGPAGRASET